MNQKIQRISIKGIIYQEGKIFMLKDEGGKWELPGGRIEFGEHIEDTFRREFQEELGVTSVDVGQPINIWDFTVAVKGDDYHFVIAVFECHVNLRDVVLSDEHSQYRWMDPDKISDYPMRDGYIESIKKFMDFKDNNV